MKTSAVAMAIFGAALVLTAAGGYHPKTKFPIGGEGGWDYLTADSDARRLYVSHGNEVDVLDLDSGAVVGKIPDTPGVHGIALAPELGRGFISAGRANKVVIFDLKTLKATGEVATGQNPDAILYDPASKRVFTFNGRSGDATAIDAANGSMLGTIPLDGKPEFAAADGEGHVFVNNEDKSLVFRLDSRKLAVLNQWPLAPCESPSGMAIDREHHRLFSGCHNKMMAIMDAETGKVIATPAIGQGVDANAFDPATKLAFSSNGDGTLTVVHEDSPDKFTIVENAKTQRGARTMALDLKTHNILLAIAEFGEAPAGGGRPPIVPGSFAILVMEK